MVLIGALGSLVFWSFEQNKNIRGDFELTREMLYITERITDDANLAEKVELLHYNDNEGLRIYYRKQPGGGLDVIYYGKMEAPESNLYRMVAHDASGPVTGDSILGRVNITDFKTEKISPHTVSLEISGASGVTGRTYELKSAVYVQGDIIEKY